MERKGGGERTSGARPELEENDWPEDDCRSGEEK